MSARVSPSRVRAFEVFAAALAEARAKPGHGLILHGTTGETKAHPRGKPVPPGWHWLAIYIKQPTMSCAA